ncbi:stage V sporulation protein AA [Paenibacillus riograndensis]|uniref:Stage V sporulation protein AA n=2 Tax=Paenibacillus riograndensis TaxID=483937 RepID=A0A132TTP7_9BACL|nr:stage V sporulation protein AA [Paenibacillus riograndensis]KWX74624.1 stage V sporulation protein AA [Paenibacillus riograndensis]CQR56956.1 stage V sporulation protein AA [Paenibacillus riograndensis SBR5]
MTAHSAPAIYIQLKNRVTVPKGKGVLLRDVAYLITDPEWREPLYSLLLLDPVQSDGNLILIDLLTVIPKIHELVPGADIQPIGEGRTLVQIEGPVEARKPSIALFVLVWLLLFFGSALTIMNFHADVSMLEVQVRIVEMLTGRRDEHPYVFQIAYSLGIGFGMVIFFNHLFKKKWNEEPTPLEVEMFLYQKNIDHYVVNEEYSKMKNNGDESSRRPGRGKRL